jgi:hypothetical protein
VQVVVIDRFEQIASGRVMRGFTRRARATVRHLGYDVRRVDACDDERWHAYVEPLRERRRAQTLDDATALSQRYREPVFGEITAYELLERLARCIDVGDRDLGLVSQLVHALQVVDALQEAGVDDPDLVVAALFHDVGKLLLSVADDPAHVVGPTRMLGDGGVRAGLDRCVFQWGADEYAYGRLVGRVPDHVSWLVRYHSLLERDCRPFMDDRDVEYTERYLQIFQVHDGGSKSWTHVPARGLEHYRGLVEERFPEPLVF